MRRALPAILALALLLAASDASASRIKDVAYVDGVRPNQLIGYGLVVGLDGTGDTQRVGFTRQSVTAMLSRSGIRFEPKELMLRNVAAVMVTAKLPAYAQPGVRLDVTVSSIGNARSLAGGTLLMTPLKGPDGQPYALAQGPLQVAGFSIGGRSGGRLRRNHRNVGHVMSGGIVEQSVPIQLSRDDKIAWRLRRPDFKTAQLIAAAINAQAQALGGQADWARAVDAGTVTVDVTGRDAATLPQLVAGLGDIEVTPDAEARVVVNGRTGTIVMGDDVRLSTVAVAHHGLNLEIRPFPGVGPVPGTAAPGQEPPPDTRTPVEKGQLQVVSAGATLADVVAALNALGVEPRDLVQILHAIRAAGALHAELEVL